MGQSSVFQIALIIIFSALVAIAVLIFALGGIGGGGGSQQVNVLRPVTVWGTFPQQIFTGNMSTLRQIRGGTPVIDYRYIDPRFFDSTITEALATAGGPDLFLVDETVIQQHQQKITSISFETFPPREFKDTYVEGAEIFLFPEYTYAIPFAVDPLVMYWNRDLISAGGFSAPPKYWDEMYDYVEAITKRTPDGLDITRATVALGDFQNIDHATEILSTLFMQTGARIAFIDTLSNGRKRTDLSVMQSRIVPALRYYTEFTNPTSPAYTWNRALASSRDAFLGNKLALYFGYASEARFLREANPNLNFDITTIPQPRDLARPLTYGRMYGLAISRMSQNKQGALFVARMLTESGPNQLFTDALGMSSVRRDLIGTTPLDPWKSVTYRSALNAKAWYQPTTYYSDNIFETLVNSVISGSENVDRAVVTASQDLDSFLR